MKLFGLNKNKAQTVPAEVQDYYRSERRERTGLAWLLALGTLIVTLLIAAGLFFGGRWVYQKITGSGSTNSTTTQQQEEAKKEEGKTSSTSTENPQPASSATSQQQQAPPTGQSPTGGQGTPPSLVSTGPIE